MKAIKIIIYLIVFFLTTHSCIAASSSMLPTNNATRPIKILALDSGGIHGVVSTYALRYLEEKSGKPIDQMFDLIVCVSTGAIQTAMLTMPNAQELPLHTATDLLNYYNTQVTDLFHVPLWWKVTSLNGFIRPALNSDMVYEAIGKSSQNLKLSDLLNHVIFVAYDLRQHQLVLFDNLVAKKNPSMDFKLQDVVYGAVSAPTKIGPRVIYSIDRKNKYVLVDGAVMATDPAMLAFAVASEMYPNNPKYLLSLGDGQNPPKINLEKINHWGILEWVAPLFNVLLNARTVLTQDLLKKLYQDKLIRLDFYVRIDPVLPEEVADIFGSSPEQMSILNKTGQDVVQQYKKQLDFFA